MSAWESIPELPGYEINELGHVRNLRGYVVAHGKGACLKVNGKSTYFSRGALRALAKQYLADPLMPASAEKPETPDKPAVTPSAIEPGSEDENPLASCPVIVGHMRDYNQPEHVRSVGDPWAEGIIEPNFPHCWDGVM